MKSIVFQGLDSYAKIGFSSLIKKISDNAAIHHLSFPAYYNDINEYVFLFYSNFTGVKSCSCNLLNDNKIIIFNIVTHNDESLYFTNDITTLSFNEPISLLERKIQLTISQHATDVGIKKCPYCCLIEDFTENEKRIISILYKVQNKNIISMSLLLGTKVIKYYKQRIMSKVGIKNDIELNHFIRSYMMGLHSKTVFTLNR